MAKTFTLKLLLIMSKPSFTKEEQVSHLSEKWHLHEDRVRQMLLDVRNMYSTALIRGERVYIDNLGTLIVEVKPPIKKRLPGSPVKTLIGARVNVKFEESETLIDELTTAFSEQIQAGNGQYF